MFLTFVRLVSYTCKTCKRFLGSIARRADLNVLAPAAEPLVTRYWWLLALVVSLTMVVLSLVATNFGPRIVRNFIRRRSTQLVIGGFIATFVFSLLVLLSVSSGRGQVFVPLVSTWLAVAMVLASTGVLVAWVHDLAFSIQIGHCTLDWRANTTDRGLAHHGLPHSGPLARHCAACAVSPVTRYTNPCVLLVVASVY